MRGFIFRHPLVFALLLNLIVAGLALATHFSLPTLTSEWQASIADTLILACAALLLTGLGWWRAAGFNRVVEWRNLHLAWYPLLITALALSGGVRIDGAQMLAAIAAGVLIGAFQEEMLLRGLQWRALLPTGVMRTVITTTLLFSALHFLTVLWGASIGGAIINVLGTACAGITYAALRFRTNTIWVPLLLHIAWNLAADLADPAMSLSLFWILNLGTLGLLPYGLFLLRHEWLRGQVEAGNVEAIPAS